MRLTTLARMDLHPGRAYALDVDVSSDPGRGLLPLSFDQHRHCTLGRRPGSWMALTLRLPVPASLDDIAEAYRSIIARHGTLRTIVCDGAQPGDPGSAEHPVLQQVRISPRTWRALEPVPAPEGADVPASGSTSDATSSHSSPDPRWTLRREFDASCQPFARPSHRLAVVVDAAATPTSDVPTGPLTAATIIVGMDHSHTDAWSLAVLARDFSQAIREVVDGVEPFHSQAAVPSFGKHTRVLAALPPAPTDIAQRWHELMTENNGEMPTAPTDLGLPSESTPPPEFIEIHDVLDAAGVEALGTRAKELGVGMISLALSAMTEATLEHTGQPLRAIFPVHSRNAAGGTGDARYWHESLGWFITNSIIECHSPEPTACHRAVRAAVQLGSYPLAPLLAEFGGMPHTPGMLAVSWLDNRRLPVDVPAELHAQHVSAPIHTNGVMVWFVVTEQGLRLRCRYPDTPTARRTMGAWVAAICTRLTALAAPD